MTSVWTTAAQSFIPSNSKTGFKIPV